MRFTLNTQKEDMFRGSWSSYLAHLNGKKLPERPGPGWLQGTAAYYDLCTAIFYDENGLPIVCGNKTNGYLCQSCLDLAEKMGG